MSKPPSASTPPNAKFVARRLYSYLKLYKSPLTIGLVCGIGAAAVQTGIAGLLKKFIDGLEGHALGTNQEAVHSLTVTCILVVAAYLSMGLLKYGQSVYLATVAQRVGQSIRRDVYSHLQSLSLAYFHKRRTGALISTLTSDVTKLQNAAMMIKDVVTTPFQILFALAAMVYLSKELTLFVVLAAPIMAWAIQRLTRRIRGISKQTQARLADVASVMEETLAAPRIVRAFTAEKHEIERFNVASEYAIQSQLKSVRRSARLGPTVDFMGAVGIAAVLFFGGLQVLHGKMATGSLIAFFALATNVANNFTAFGSLKTAWEDMMGAADRLFQDVLDVQPEVQEALDPSQLPPVSGRIQFEDVYFSYQAGQPILSGINLTIEPGEVVALVGETGAGKTTLADLIPRFYDPIEGRVTVDGHDLRAVSLQSLRKQIALVPQETLLFSGTIHDNIAYGRRDALDAEVRAAARAANISEFIESLPEGYETWIGERGATISGGQRQRIAIARALLADPRILILDEATSALDAQTEASVQEALETLMQGRTTVIIAHRLSTIVNADKIIVLKRGGVIAEMGSHDELMAQGGMYAGLFEMQRFASQGNGVNAVPTPLVGA